MDHKIIEIEYGAEGYEGLKALWCEVFGDMPEFVDAFYENFGADTAGYAVVDESGGVCSALTCHLCGSYVGKPVYVSYAVCTREDMRGKGLAAMLVTHVRDRVTEAGGISIVSPAEPSLVSYYEQLGYEPYFFSSQRAVMSPEFDTEEYEDYDEFDLDIDGADPTPFRADIDLQTISAERYGRFREAFLAGQPHIEPSDDMLALIEAESMDGCGLYSVNRGDAVCAVSSANPAQVIITELVLNPVLKELSLDIDAEIAAMTAKHFGAAEALFGTPGYGACQGMACGLPQLSPDNSEENSFEIPYYGFPVK